VLSFLRVCYSDEKVRKEKRREEKRRAGEER
jgi:hypothetical protein